MRKKPIGLLVAGLLLVWMSALVDVRMAASQDCSVQILSVVLNKSTLSIGETLHANISYSLLYDSQDPLAVGGVTVSINSAGQEQPILTFEYTERGVGVRKTASVGILPTQWEPNETGQVGLLRVSGWVQDSYGSMTDYVESDFRTVRSDAQLTLQDAPSQVVFHDQLVLATRITNAHNSSIVLQGHPVRIEVRDTWGIVQAWTQSTSPEGVVAQTVETEGLGTGSFICNITSEPDGDYLVASIQFPFEVVKPSLLLVPQLNATAYLAYYPAMSNCTALLRASLVCSSHMHDVSEANVTWSLAGEQGVLEYSGAGQFGGQVAMPQIPGNYTISIRALLPDHNSTETLLPVIVEPRESILFLAANRTQAAYGDFIALHFRVIDKACSKPVCGKQVLFYVFAQTDWVLLASAVLDDNGEHTVTWQAQDVGNPQQFLFRAVFQGSLEFDQREISTSVENTRDVRFFIASSVPIVRGKPANLTVRITTLQLVPMPNLTVELIEELTNQCWCSATTNGSGYAYLGWSTPVGIALGSHRFFLLAADETETRGCIVVVLVIYDGTVLTLASSGGFPDWS